MRVIILLLGVASLAGAAVVAVERAHALPAYAQQTRKACGYCHTSPTGGGALTAAGKRFAAKGHKL